MGEAQGKKVDPSAVAAQAIEAQPLTVRSSQEEARGPRAPNSILRRRRGGHQSARTRRSALRAKEKKRWRTERRPTSVEATENSGRQTNHRALVDRRSRR